MERSQTVGALCMAGTAVCFSLGGLLIKFIPWSPLAINGCRSILAAAVVGLFLVLSKHKICWTRSVWIGAVCLCISMTLFTVANKLTSAANAIVIQYTAPIFVILFMWLFLRERPKRGDVVACICVLMGIVCFFLDGITAGGMAGNLVALAAGAAYGGVFMMNSSRGVDPLSSIFLGLLMSSVIGLPFLFGETDFSGQVIAAVLPLGIVQQGFAWVFFYLCIERITPLTACLVGGIEPVLNPLLVAIFYGEMVTVLSLCGAIIVIATIVTYNAMKIRRPALVE